jgi:two-component system phosphate regulon sensor histidine kinase PhoR
MRLSLRLRVVISFAALLILVIGGLGIYLWSFVRQTYLDNLQNYLLAETRIVSQEASIHLESASPNSVLPSLAQRFGTEMNASVTYFLPTGEVAGSSSTNPDAFDNNIERPEIKAALSGKEITIARFSQTANQDLLYAAVPVRAGGQIAGVARLAVPLSSIESSMTIFGTRILIVTFLTLILAIGLAFFLTNNITKPLRVLTQRVLKMGAGKQSQIKISDEAEETIQLEQAFDQLETELNAQIEALTDERSTLSSVLSSLTDGVVIINATGAILLINPAVERTFNITLQNVIGQSMIEIFRNHQLVELWQKCQETGEQQVITFETSPNRLYIQAIAVSLHQSMPGSTLLVLQDLTRMRRLEMIRRDFVSNVSHELRTPLASLKALTETLQEGALEDPPAARRFLLRMENEIDNLTQLVQELLELSRIESGKVPLKQKLILPADLVERAFDRMQLQAERTGLKISCTCEPDLPAINIDRDRMEQVLVNLIHNAIKFTPPGGEISIEAYASKGNVIFKVRDSGVGIAEDALPRIFERFYKADRSRSGGGTGLGLSIARHLVEAHGGKIWAESIQGSGSTFYVSIPTATSV